jgi:predicted ATP-grasp superfamily ATP-dependent carboligase
MALLKNYLRPAIVLGSHNMGLAVIRALGEMGVPVVVVVSNENEEMGYGSKFVRERISAPHPEKAQDQFIDVLMKCGDRLDGGLLIPTSDETLCAVSRCKALLERHYLVACTDWSITDQFINKKYTYALADAIGVAAPKTIIPHSPEDVERYSKTVEFPCLVKPSQSHSYFEKFKRKMVQVNNLNQMLSAYQEAADAGLETILQEWIPGEDSEGVNYNSYFWDGEPLVEFTAQKIRNAPPQFGSPRIALSKHIPEVLEPGRKILKAMGFYGFSCTEFKRDPRDGIYKLMEVNGRHNRSGLLAKRCGINFPWIQYQHLVCGELPASSDFQTGIYWVDIYRDLGYSLLSFRKEKYTFSQYIQPYLSPHIDSTWDVRDLKPFMQRGMNLVKRKLRVPDLK